MANRDIITRNGDATNMPAVRREESDYPSPYRDINRWMSQWDQWFDNMFNRALGLSPFRDRESLMGSGWQGMGSFMPAVNVVENENDFRITAELPGIEPSDVELTLNRGVLTIRGEKKQEKVENERGMYRRERSYGSFQRSVSLPEQVDHDNVDANFRNGVLTITVPKLPELKSAAKRIEIKGEQK